jgi:hypothetical protein
MQQAQAEGLTLLVAVAANATGYFGVQFQKPGKPMPYYAMFRHGDINVSLGHFATAEGAALSIARTPEGQAIAAARAAARAAAPPRGPPLTSEGARKQAQAEGLTLLVAVAANQTGYYGVGTRKSPDAPYVAKIYILGKKVNLGCFATAEEAALSIARTPEGKAIAAARAAAPAAAPPRGPPLTSEGARKQAQAEGLILRMAASNATGYYGVKKRKSSPDAPYVAVITILGKRKYLGCYATAEEAALSIARRRSTD